jgi:hypothetical protein
VAGKKNYTIVEPAAEAAQGRIQGKALKRLNFPPLISESNIQG